MDKSKENFPVIFGRKGGSRFDLLDCFKCTDIECSANILLVQQAEIENLKSLLIDETYSIIGAEDNPEFKNTLINFKRDLFNNRKTKKYHELILRYDKLCEGFEALERKTNAYKSEFDKYRLTFQEEFFGSIRNLKYISEKTFFKNGLLFSSDVLSKVVADSDFDYQCIDKKNKRLIISTIKYLSRSVAKTTPLSSFSNMYYLENGYEQFTSINTQTRYSKFRITNLFFYYLKESLLKKICFKNCLLVYCNSTIWKEQGNTEVFHFFVNKANNETFKRLDKSPILCYINNELSKREVSYCQLIEEIKTITEEKKETIIKYINTLIKEGFLHLTYPVSCNNKNWIGELLDFIHNRNEISESFNELTFILKNIQRTITNLENTSNISDRRRYIKESYNELSQFLSSLNGETDFANKVSSYNLYYEDTFCDSMETISAKRFNNASKDLKQAFFHLNNIPYKENFKKKMAKYLKKEYNGELPILLFYNKIYLNRFNENTFDKSELAVFQKSFDRIVKLINDNGSENSIDLSKIIYKQKNLQFTSSIGCYVQVTSPNLDRLVVNSFSSGYGSNISRFLNFMPEKLIEKVVRNNKSNCCEYRILADIKDASIHNANTYPPLTDYVINVIDDNTLNTKYESIGLSNIWVCCDNAKGIVLKNEKGVEIQPNSFSLEGLNRRSKFTQFLDLFNPIDLTGYFMYKNNIKQLFKERLINRELVCIPRLIYGHNIVISRKKWLVKKSVFTNLLNMEKIKLNESYLSINQWVVKNQIPNEVFVIIAQKDSTNHNNDNYKPQYINFKIPVFLLLFINMIKKSESIIEITEMYPDSSHIKESGGFVKEYILNLN